MGRGRAPVGVGLLDGRGRLPGVRISFLDDAGEVPQFEHFDPPLTMERCYTRLEGLRDVCGDSGRWAAYGTLEDEMIGAETSYLLGPNHLLYDASRELRGRISEDIAAYVSVAEPCLRGCSVSAAAQNEKGIYERELRLGGKALCAVNATSLEVVAQVSGIRAKEHSLLYSREHHCLVVAAGTDRDLTLAGIVYLD